MAQCRSSLAFFLSDELIQDFKYKDTQGNIQKARVLILNVQTTAMGQQGYSQETINRNLVCS